VLLVSVKLTRNGFISLFIAVTMYYAKTDTMLNLDRIAMLEQVRSEIMQTLNEKWQSILDYLQSPVTGSQMPPTFDETVSATDRICAIQAEIDTLNDIPIEPPPAKRSRLSPELVNATVFEPSIDINEEDEQRCIGSLLKE